MPKVVLPYWKTVDWMIVVIAAIILIFTLSCGRHYDCANWDKYDSSALSDVIDYCKSDRMKDNTKDELGRQKEWRR